MHMTRLTYQAPGVYVEEIPSARQPIAGVGTNTAAFIGIVPDTIYYPVPNPDYDPVAAGDELKKAREAQKKPAEAPTTPVTEGQPTETPPPPEGRKRPSRISGPEISGSASAAGEGRGFAGPAAEPDTLRTNGWLEPPEKPRTPGEIQSKTPEREKAPAEHPYYLKAFNIEVAPWDTKFCTNFTEYMDRFGPFSAFVPGPDGDRPMYPGHHALTHAVYGFFKNGGTRCFVARVRGPDELTQDKVLKNLESIDEVALIAAPGFPQGTDVWNSLMEYAEDDNHENVFAI